MEISRPDINTKEIVEFPVNERFIKLPIKKYLELIDIEPIEPQIALINAINDPQYRFITAALARRTGKTFIANVIAQLVTLIPGTHILVIAPNYSLSQISWDEQVKLLKLFDIELEKKNVKDKVIQLANGSVIRIGSATQADSVVGRSYDLIIFDEAALIENGKDIFNIQLLPTLDKPNAKAIFISTPRGKNWFYEYWKRGFSEDERFKAWVSLRSTWKDSPRAIPEAIETARASMTKAEHDQEFYCSFNALQGQIYNLKLDQIVDLDISTIEVEDVIAGLDIGFRDATAMCVLLCDGQNFYLVDEYVRSGVTTKEHAKAISAMCDKWDIDFIYIDHSAAQTRHDFAMMFDISTINAKKSLLDGLGYVQMMTENDRLFVDKKCKESIDMFDAYKWDLRKGLIAEKPAHDPCSHIADALRYAMYSYSTNIVLDIDAEEESAA